MKNSKLNWKDDVIYPITLFSIACLILLLSSFSTKAKYEAADLRDNIEIRADYKSSALAANGYCERTVSYTKGCDGDSNYIFFLRSTDPVSAQAHDLKHFSISASSEVSWTQRDDQIHFLATNLVANRGSGERLDVDITYSGLTSNPPQHSPKANRCFDPNTQGWTYYTSTEGFIVSNQHGRYRIVQSKGASVFQIGAGANVQASSGFGASGWIDVVGGDGYWGTGVVNVQLSQTCSLIEDGSNPSSNLSAKIKDVSDGNQAEILTGSTILNGINESDVDAGFNLPLDISMVSFTGRYVEDRDMNSVEWITSAELDVDYFILERSFENGTFEFIAKVDAKGSNNAEALYTHDDSKIEKRGNYKYRLQQVAQDGSTSHGDIISVAVRSPQITDPTINVFPNPAQNTVNIHATKGESDIVSVKMFDLTGKAMSLNGLQVTADANDASVQIPVKNLPRAAYILRINIGDEVFAKKIDLAQ